MKLIKGYENYSITEDGQVFNNKTKRFLTPSINRDGYKYIHLGKNGKIKALRIHRLVAETYIPNTENKLCVNHLDMCKTNNNVNNLEWVTRKENAQHYYLNTSKEILKLRYGKPKKVNL